MTVTILPNPKVLTNNKWPLGIDPGGHHFVVLNVSINKKPFFFSEVVTYENRSSKRLPRKFEFLCVKLPAVCSGIVQSCSQMINL